MNLLIPIILVTLATGAIAVPNTEPQEKAVDLKRKKLTIKLSESLSQDPEKNPFLKALEALPNGFTGQDEIENILGVNYSKVKAQVHAAREYAAMLIKDEVRLYQDTLPFDNPGLMPLFKDFYDLMDLRLNPDTIFLNKESYVFFMEIPESQFVTVYTMLAERYEEFIPLDKRIDATERSFMRMVHQIVPLKCPDYENREPEKFSAAKQIEGDAPEVEQRPVDKPVEFDRDTVKNIFETLHTPVDPNYVNKMEFAEKLSAMLVAFILALLAN